MGGIILVAIAVAVVVWLVKGKGYGAARARNSIVSWATGEEGYCCECKHCIKDDAHRYSETGWYCSISKCDCINECTRMKCFEKPTVTEDDLRQLFALGVWTAAGQQFIRESILGKKMTFSEIDAFLKEIPSKYPHYIDPEYVRNHQDSE